jgi:hypothetical protein
MADTAHPWAEAGEDRTSVWTAASSKTHPPRTAGLHQAQAAFAYSAFSAFCILHSASAFGPFLLTGRQSRHTLAAGDGNGLDRACTVWPFPLYRRPGLSKSAVNDGKGYISGTELLANHPKMGR